MFSGFCGDFLSSEISRDCNIWDRVVYWVYARDEIQRPLVIPALATHMSFMTYFNISSPCDAHALLGALVRVFYNAVRILRGPS